MAAAWPRAVAVQVLPKKENRRAPYDTRLLKSACCNYAAWEVPRKSAVIMSAMEFTTMSGW
jgi:hypothetical protein